MWSQPVRFKLTTMSVTSIIGLLMSLGVLVIGLYGSSPNIMVFWDGISVFIVLGGTVAATSISFKLERILFLAKVFFKRVLQNNNKQSQVIVGELIQLADAYKKRDTARLNSMIAQTKDAFLKEAMEMVMDGFIDHDRMLDILEKRKENLYASYLVDANKFKVIGKYPPAFGMMGTTIGMIVLLANLGGPDSAKTIGPAMGICLITTLYGVAFSNLLIMPVAEFLAVDARDGKTRNTIICQGIKLMLEGENAVLIAEELNSFFIPGERVNWKNFISVGSNAWWKMS